MEFSPPTGEVGKRNELSIQLAHFQSRDAADVMQSYLLHLL